MKRRCCVLLVAMAMAATACSTTTSTPTTLGVDGAPQVIRDVFLTVTRQAATLAGYDATNEQWLEFARQVCSAGFGSSEARAAFVAAQAGPRADQTLTQMWATAAEAATSSFCPIGPG